MGRKHIQSLTPGRGFPKGHADSPGVRRDATKAFAITLLAHGVLVVILGWTLVERAKPEPVLLVASFAEDSELDSSEKTEAIQRRQTKKTFHPETMPPMELPDPLIASNDFAFHSVSDIEIPDLQESLRVYHSVVQARKNERLQREQKKPTRVASERGKVILPGWIGIELTMNLNYRLPGIVRVIEGGPAHQQGALKASNYGDYIITVDGQSTANLSLREVRDLIVGEIDSIVVLGICKLPGSVITEVKIRRGR